MENFMTKSSPMSRLSNIRLQLMIDSIEKLGVDGILESSRLTVKFSEVKNRLGGQICRMHAEINLVDTPQEIKAFLIQSMEGSKVAQIDNLSDGSPYAGINVFHNLSVDHLHDEALQCKAKSFVVSVFKESMHRELKEIRKEVGRRESVRSPLPLVKDKVSVLQRISNRLSKPIKDVSNGLSF
jgi:hypothetical protein